MAKAAKPKATRMRTNAWYYSIALGAVWNVMYTLIAAIKGEVILASGAVYIGVGDVHPLITLAIAVAISFALLRLHSTGLWFAPILCFIFSGGPLIAMAGHLLGGSTHLIPTETLMDWLTLLGIPVNLVFSLTLFVHRDRFSV
ncbi:hypothetical protein JYT83_01315 [bacterium AH-315-F18]|nr:hypothetical protein [bacterium AH-315-F18]